MNSIKYRDDWLPHPEINRTVRCKVCCAMRVVQLFNGRRGWRGRLTSWLPLKRKFAAKLRIYEVMRLLRIGFTLSKQKADSDLVERSGIFETFLRPPGKTLRQSPVHR